jgi:hypothetical protein
VSVLDRLCGRPPATVVGAGGCRLAGDTEFSEDMLTSTEVGRVVASALEDGRRVREMAA